MLKVQHQVKEDLADVHSLGIQFSVKRMKDLAKEWVFGVAGSWHGIQSCPLLGHGVQSCPVLPLHPLKALHV